MDLLRFSGEALAHFAGSVFELHWALVVEGGVSPDWVVEAVDIAGNGLFGILPGPEACSPDQLGFQGLEERLDHGVIVAIASSGH